MKLPWPTDPTQALSLKLGLWGGAMFVFAIWIMPPLYDVFCDITGLNGKTGGRYEVVEAKVDMSRTIKVQFIATNNAGMPWEFGSELRSVLVHPGEHTRINYNAQNPTGRTMVAQAVPSITPFKASSYFHKTECFCFEQQALMAGESTVLPLYFIVDQDIPEQIKTITLSYTLFDVTGRFDEQQIMAMVQESKTTKSRL